LIKRLLIVLFIFYSLFNISANSLTEDSLYIKKIFFEGNYKIKEPILRNIIKIKEGKKYSIKDINGDIRRLYDEKIFRDVKIFIEENHDSATLIYYLEDKTYSYFLPQLHYISLPNGNEWFITASFLLRLKNLNGFNELNSFYIEGYKRKIFSFGLYNPSLTKNKIILGVNTLYINTPSLKIENLTEEKENISFILGRQNNKLQGVRLYIGFQLDRVDSLNLYIKQNKYPFVGIEWKFFESDFRYYPKKRTYAKVMLKRYGGKSWDVDYYKLILEGSLIRDFYNFLFMIRKGEYLIFNSNKIYFYQRFFAGGDNTIRVYPLSSLPYDREGVNILNILQTELVYPIYHLKDNIKLNWIGDFLETYFLIGIWFDVARLQRDFGVNGNYYWSYGVGIRGWNVKFSQYGSIDIGINKEKKFSIFVSNTFIF